jgi:hypothetical protein
MLPCTPSKLQASLLGICSLKVETLANLPPAPHRVRLVSTGIDNSRAYNFRDYSLYEYK